MRLSGQTRISSETQLRARVLQLQQAESILQERCDLLPEDLLPACGKLRILGCISDLSPAKGKQAARHDWLDFHIVDGLPTCDNTLIVLYTPPNARKLRFLSVKPLKMNITAYRSRDTPELFQPNAQDRLSELARQSIASDFIRRPMKAADLEKITLQMNSARECQAILSEEKSKTGRRSELNTRKTRKERNGIFFKPLILLAAFLNYRPFGKNALKDLSATAHQLDVRLQQLTSASAQLKASYSRNRLQPDYSRAHYISFYGTLWLVANDIIIGFALLTFLTDNADLLADTIARILKLYGVRLLQESVLWLNDWPGGLKLNYELGKFFSDAFLWFAAGWEDVVLDGILIPALPLVLRTIGLSAMFGTTMALSVMSDLLALSTFHLYAFYTMATAAFRFHTQAVRSLFHIFRGKKYNTIRNRVEPSEYHLDQLLIGSVLFTLAAFLFPTVLAYYLLFASSRLCIILIHASLEGILAFLNHFPLFSLMLRLKDPDRLPVGLQFSILTCNDTPVMELKNNPISLGAIFHQYWSLWSSFSQHYSPFYLLGKVISGRYINAIPRSRLVFLDNTASP